LADDDGPAKKEAAVSQTEYLLFLSNTCIDELAGVIQAHYELLESGKSSREAKRRSTTALARLLRLM
jgi:hypothetical protein